MPTGDLEGIMKNIKFVVKVNRGGAHAPQYVLRVDQAFPSRPQPIASWPW
jgi:hypothetical protein